MRPKLLVADDSVTIRRVIELTFAGEGVDVMSVSNGRLAIEQIELERPDIVLADVDMPERSGYEVAWFVKNKPDLAHIPVVLLTGAFEPVDEIRAQETGCRGVLGKPFEPEVVVRRVRDLLAESEVWRAWAASAPALSLSGEERELEISVGGSGPSFAPAPQVPPHSATETLDEYLDRLDTHFGTGKDSGGVEQELPLRETTAPAPAQSAHATVDASVSPAPETSHKTADPPHRDRPAPRAVHPPGRSLADDFAMLLAAEETGGVSPDALGRSRLTDDSGGSMAGFSTLALSAESEGDPVVARAARRVVEVLAEHLTKDMVSEVVKTVAERLVREDLDRHPPHRA